MDLFEAIEGRRSVRTFLPDPVDEKDLRRMLDAARRAPSGGNVQPWHFLVVRRRETLAAMSACILRRIEEVEAETGAGEKQSDDALAALARRFRYHSLFFASAPVTLAVLVEENSYVRPLVEHLEGTGLDRREIDHLLGHVEIQSVAAAIQNLLLAAHALGYGACWMNVPFLAREELKTILGVSPPRDLLALVPVGRPAPRQPATPVPRRPVEEIATFD
jgi:nitroreductase